MPPDQPQSHESVQSLIDALVAALSLRAWIDDEEQRHETRKEIVRRVKAGESNPTPVVALLDHGDWAVRRDAVEMLGWIGDWETSGPLIARLWLDRSEAVRGAIALALERIGAPEALAASKEYSHTIHSYPEVAGRAADLAGQDIFDVALQGMTGICIEDTVETPQGKMLAFDLADLLAVPGERARSSLWCCREVECMGEYASEMHAIGDRGLAVAGRTLAHIALLIDQTIDGTFVALGEDARPWLAIRAVDTSWFEVWASEPALLDLFRSRFQHVTDI